MPNFKLKKISCGDYGNLIETSEGCFVLGKMTSNKYDLYEPSVSAYIKPVYRTNEFVGESFFGNSVTNSDYTSSSFVETSAMVNTQVSITQNGSQVLFTLVPHTGANVIYRDDVSGFTYANDTLSVCDKNLINDDASFQSLSAPHYILSGFNYSYISELPLDMVYFDFDSGKIYSNVYKLKDFLDYNFKMDASVVKSGFYENIYLNNTRTYNRIGSNNDDMYLVYSVGKNLSGIQIQQDTSDFIPTNIVYTTENSSGINSYEFVDRLKQVNRYRSSALHKSNVFSVRIKDSGLNETITDLDVRNKVQLSIENVIRSNVKKIKPADTELWKVEWLGK